MNATDLYQRLVAAGLLPAQKADEEEEAKCMKPVDFTQPETLKVRQPGLVALLHSGTPCSSCGIRFTPEETMKYRQHLDWHFRQNRRQKQQNSRSWLYSLSDWMQSEETEDLEERAPCWFEKQQAAKGGENVVREEVPTVYAGENPADRFCRVCGDKFDIMWNDENEEWQLRAAVRVDGITFHPLCYEDYKVEHSK